MSKVALYQRVAKSAAWLEWLTVHFCREHEYLMERPEWLRDFRVTIADATKAMGKELYTLHMMIKLFSLSATCAVELQNGEKRSKIMVASRRPIRRNEVAEDENSNDSENHG